MSDPDTVYKKVNIPEKYRAILKESIARKMAPQPVKIRADFELTCLTYEGIDAIKEALITAKKEINAEILQALSEQKE